MFSVSSESRAQSKCVITVWQAGVVKWLVPCAWPRTDVQVGPWAWTFGCGKRAGRPFFATI